MPVTLRVLLCIAALAVSTGSVRSPCVVAGTVVTADSDEAPVRKAIVTLAEDGGTLVSTQVSDDAGAFEFADVPAGRFMLSADKPAFLKTAYGARVPGRPGVTLVLGPGESRGDLRLRLFRGAAITGVVRDGQGRPVPHAYVVALQKRFTESGRTLMQASPKAATWGAYGPMTDDRGMYRLYDLLPGDYLVLVGVVPARAVAPAYETTPGDIARALRLLNEPVATRPTGLPTLTIPSAVAPGSSALVYPAPVYFPGTYASTAATTITLRSGDEIAGIDVSLSLIRSVRIQGTLTNADGMPLQRAAVQVIGGDFGNNAPSSLAVDREGHFEHAGVGPGTYVIEARTSPLVAGRNTVDEGSVLWGSLPIDVAGNDLTDLAMVLRPGATLSGTIVTTPNPQSNLQDPIEVKATPDAPQPGSWLISRVVMSKDGRFTFGGMPPGRYRISARPPSNWTMVGATIDGRDVADNPIELQAGGTIAGVVVTMAAQSSELVGTVQAPVGLSRSDYLVVVYPVDRRAWYWQSRWIGIARADTAGRYAIHALPAGDYRLAAVTDLEPGEWFDPGILEQLRQLSIPVRIAAGAKTVQDIRIGH